MASVYNYPEWVKSVWQIQRINKSAAYHLWVSLLKCDSGMKLDIRVWTDEGPGIKGIIINTSMAEKLRDALDEYLSGEMVASIDDTDTPIFSQMEEDG